MKAVLIITLALLTSLSISALGQAHDETTPYGDYCGACSKYGVCKQSVSNEDSRTAIEGYYREKGMEVGEMRYRGRFIEVEILKGGQMVDKILFDRKSGRIRSIY